MPTTRDEKTAGLREMLEWLYSLYEKNVSLDEFELFIRASSTNPSVRRAVSAALEAEGAPPLSQLTRESFYALTKPQYETALDALMRALNLTLQQLRNLFCVELQWCERHKSWTAGWKRMTGRLMKYVPGKLRKPVGLMAWAAPYIWEAIDIFWKLTDMIAPSVLLGRVSLLLAIAALDKLCGCDERK
jgi:hypothetical protein